MRLPQKVEHWSLTTLREKLVKIGAKVVRHGRYVTFQLAEVAVPRNLFREILRLIDGPRQGHQHGNTLSFIGSHASLFDYRIRGTWLLEIYRLNGENSMAPLVRRRRT